MQKVELIVLLRAASPMFHVITVSLCKSPLLFYLFFLFVLILILLLSWSAFLTQLMRIHFLVFVFVLLYLLRDNGHITLLVSGVKHVDLLCVCFVKWSPR